MSVQPFIFGGNTGHSYEDVKRLREQAKSLQPTGDVKTGVAGFGHGLSTLGRALIARSATKKADQLEQQGREDYNKSFDAWQNAPQTESAGGQDSTNGIGLQLFELANSPYASNGQKAFAQYHLQKLIQGAQPQERQVVADAMGRKRYQDDGSFLFGDMADYDKNVLSEAAVAQKQAIAKAGSSRINVNSGGDQARMLSDEDKQSLGLDPRQPFLWSKDGTPKAVKPSTFTESQASAAGYASRMQAAMKRMQEIIDSGYDPTSVVSKVGASFGALGNYALNPQAQAFQQAADDWARAKLRYESGAQIAPSEMSGELKNYMPQPGDSKEVLEAKRQAQQIALDALIQASGGAYKANEGTTQEPNLVQPNTGSDIDDLLKQYGGG